MALTTAKTCHSGRPMPKRGGRNTRKIRESLSEVSKAYRSVVRPSKDHYNGSHGFRSADGTWTTYVTSARLKTTEPLLKYHDENPDGSIRSVSPDMLHASIVHELEHPIQTEVILDPFDKHLAKRDK